MRSRSRTRRGGPDTAIASPIWVGASTTRDAADDPISDAIVTVKKCHRQQIRRFLTGSSGARNALSYTKRRCVRTSELTIDGSLGEEMLVPIEGAKRAHCAPAGESGSWHLACSLTNPTNRFRDDQRPETLGGRENA